MSHDDKGYSEEKCLRCGWVMGSPPLNCNNDDTPHEFSSHAKVREDERRRMRAMNSGFEWAYEQGQRDVFAYHPEWTVTGMCKPDCLPCQRLTELTNERSAGYDEGQRDEREAIAQAFDEAGLTATAAAIRAREEKL